MDTDLVEIAVRAPSATISLYNALARHGLTDEIPAAVDIALPRALATGGRRAGGVAPVRRTHLHHRTARPAPD